MGLLAKHRVRLDIAYDGTNFQGWQCQNQGQNTIQVEVEQALSQILDAPVGVCGSGRTDSGVHALQQVAHFDTERDLKRYNFVKGLNTLTAKGISVQKAYRAPEVFHARDSAESKIYTYYIDNGASENPFWARYSHRDNRFLDIDRLNMFSAVLLGTQNFVSFQNHGTELRSTVRTVLGARWFRRGHLVFFKIQGTGFLKQMVRNILGTQLELYHQGENPDELKAIIEAKDRSRAWVTASARGLVLSRVIYSKDLDKKCQIL